jgi:hypothetical protein
MSVNTHKKYEHIEEKTSSSCGKQNKRKQKIRPMREFKGVEDTSKENVSRNHPLDIIAVCQWSVGLDRRVECRQIVSTLFKQASESELKTAHCVFFIEQHGRVQCSSITITMSNIVQ